MKRFIISVLTIGIIYAGINLILVGGQKLGDKDEEAKLDELKTELSDIEVSIGGYEDLLIQLEDELAGLEEDVNFFESEYPDGIPEEYYEDYTSAIDGYNEQLDTYNEEYGKYTSEIDLYNEKVEEANAVAEEIGSTYYVVPMPSGKH